MCIVNMFCNIHMGIHTLDETSFDIQIRLNQKESHFWHLAWLTAYHELDQRTRRSKSRASETSSIFSSSVSIDFYRKPGYSECEYLAGSTSLLKTDKALKNGRAGLVI